MTALYIIAGYALALLQPTSQPAPICIHHLHDGDTWTLCDGTRVRLSAIDAPEWESSPRCIDPRRRARAVCDNALAERSRDALATLLADGALCVDMGPDRYRRRLYRCTVGGVDVGATMVGGGYAEWWRGR